MKTMIPFVLALAVVGTTTAASLSIADEAPISGTVKAIDSAGKTLTLETTSKGKSRDVTILLKPDSKIVKFIRATEPGKTGFVEQALTLVDLKPGWVVSVTAKHEGGREVAEIVKVVLEK